MRERDRAELAAAVGPRPRLYADAMLVKLGRYLRCLGYDTEWDAAAPTGAAIRAADAGDRVFLTRNGHLGQNHRPPRRWLAVASTDPVEQVREVVRGLGLDPARHLFTRCVCCNVVLEELPPEEVRARRLPARVLALYRRFWGCPRCGTTFWKGTHVRNTCRKLGLPDASEG